MDVASFRGSAETRASIRKPLIYAGSAYSPQFPPPSIVIKECFSPWSFQKVLFEMEKIGIIAREFLI